jgi:DNA invertase Pin-like site-specific DNA recombinase
MGKLYGYARVSTVDQSLDMQIDALRAAGCEASHIYTDKVSGARASRPGLDKCLAAMRTGDTLIVWRIDRLGRSMPHLVKLVEQLKESGIGFRSLQEGFIDTTTATGALVLNLFSCLAEFERNLIQERTKSGLAAARARGKKGGRKKISALNPKVLAAKKMHKDLSLSISSICHALKISPTTLHRYLHMPDVVAPTDKKKTK